MRHFHAMKPIKLSRKRLCSLAATVVLTAVFVNLSAQRAPVYSAARSSRAAKPASSASPVYARDIAPIVLHACASCHQPGTAAPFSLLTYDDVKKRAPQIAELTRTRYMPPWLPKPGHGDFAGVRRLSDGQIRMIANWVKAGAPEGPHISQRTPARPQKTWPLGRPDLVVRMTQPFTLNAGDVEQCRSFLFPRFLIRDRALKAVDYRASAPGVVRHASLFADSTRKARLQQQQSGAVGWTDFPGSAGPGRRRLGEWAVGSPPVQFPKGSAMRLAPGDDLVLQLRFQPNGRQENERSEIALYFSDAPLPPPAMLALGNAWINLRPNEIATVTDAFTLPVAARLYAISPHAELMCRAIRADATLPNGAAQPLLWIPNFNLDWAEPLRYRAPMDLPAGTRITVTIDYDNSAHNPRNAEDTPMVSGAATGCTDEYAGVEFQITALQPRDIPALSQALAAKGATYTVQSSGATGHG
ncbi:MAG: hypothetical protein ABIY70_18870 [Capsulimonas sp.]|uniref:c-type cytochrome n=1 Tax=Capsulimonas sp. TaxID=2494211 RepID=UPI003264D8C5